MQAKDLCFGVEIETSVPEQYRGTFPVGGYHRGVSLPYTPRGWNGQSDASIHASRGRIGVEVVSPVLTGETGLTEVFYALEHLKEHNAKPTSSCGLHIHVDARWADSNAMEDIVTSFVSFERTLYLACGGLAKHRFESPYAKPSRQWYTTGYNGAIHPSRNYFQDRYQSLNLTNWTRPGSKRTVEFRLFPGTVTAEDVVLWAYMVVGLVSYVSENGPIDAEPEPEAAADVARFADVVWGKAAHRIIPEESAEDLTALLEGKAGDAVASGFTY